MKRAFTLIELLLLLALISIVVAISTPRFSGTYRSLKTQSEARKLASYLSFIKSRSVLDQKTYSVISSADNVLASEDLPDERYREHAIESDVSVEMQPAKLFFYPNGMMSPFLITLTDGSGNRYSVEGVRNSAVIEVRQEPED